MNSAFWHEKWKNNQINFHESAPNTLLVTHFDTLSLTEGSRVFVPLCGKTLDITWLLGQGYRVAGAELSELAIQQLFAEMEVVPDITEVGTLKHYRAPDLDIFVGNIFDLNPETLGAIDGIYDRAALVALPDTVRVQYAPHLMRLTHSAPQLLITYEYARDLMTGPPFSISDEEIQQYYSGRYDITLLQSGDVPGGLRGLAGPQEKVWLLKPIS